MKENKTQKTDKDVRKFLETVENPTRKADAFKILEILTEITQKEPILWGNSIIGFGDYHYKYKTGREGDWFEIGFSPRKQALTLYLMNGVEKNKSILDRLGKHKTGVGCVYIKKLTDIDIPTLKELIANSLGDLKMGESSS